MTSPGDTYLHSDALPLRGIKVLELSDMIMGPVTGMVLADLGAEVIKVEPIDGVRRRDICRICSANTRLRGKLVVCPNTNDCLRVAYSEGEALDPQGQ